MAWVTPTELAMGPITLVPLTRTHEQGLRAAAFDGELWRLAFTSVPTPAETRYYIEQALAQQARGERLPFVVLHARGGVIGSTSYHDVLPKVRRLEIGFTWYAQRFQRSAVNTVCKWLLLTHAFETLDARVVAWRTDHLNLRSQAAIERLGARRDGVIRGLQLRRDGSVRDTVMYSMTASEWWRSKRQHLLSLLNRALAIDSDCPEPAKATVPGAQP
jgi:N-acetyltransferase